MARENILRIREVQKRVGLSRSTIYELIKQKKFPRQVSISARAIGFLESEINSWIEDRIYESRSRAA